MQKHTNKFQPINSIAEYHKLLDLESSEHPLMSIVDFSKVNYNNLAPGRAIILNLYCLSIKQDADCILRYGPRTYDLILSPS